MPRTKMTQAIYKPKPNLLAELLKIYKDESGLHDVQIAKRMGWANRQTANDKLNQPVRMWRVGELLEYCKIVGCPWSLATEAIQESV